MLTTAYKTNKFEHLVWKEAFMHKIDRKDFCLKS